MPKFLPSSMPRNAFGALQAVDQIFLALQRRVAHPGRHPLEKFTHQVGGELGLDEPADGQDLDQDRRQERGGPVRAGSSPGSLYIAMSPHIGRRAKGFSRPAEHPERRVTGALAGSSLRTAVPPGSARPQSAAGSAARNRETARCRGEYPWLRAA